MLRPSSVEPRSRLRGSSVAHGFHTRQSSARFRSRSHFDRGRHWPIATALLVLPFFLLLAWAALRWLFERIRDRLN
jgi:hypothetical protein